MAMLTAPFVANRDNVVKAYEAALSTNDSITPADFAPDPQAPDFFDVMFDLIKVDMERRWEMGQQRYVEDYEDLFPGGRPRPADLIKLSQLELMCRRKAGQHATPFEFQERFGVNLGEWPTMAVPGALLAHQPMLRKAFEKKLPRTGDSVGNFELVRELGHGASGRVYLAIDHQLSDRLVVIKVSRELSQEWKNLSRLQHTNIVPIYSAQATEEYQAFCMPYFGSVTLAQVITSLRRSNSLPENGLTFVTTLANRMESTRVHHPKTVKHHSTQTTTPLAGEPESSGETSVKDEPSGELPESLQHQLSNWPYDSAVAWIGARMADGLSHAHSRDLLHLDLKPANTLWADHGQPMLLDFNLSQDIKKLAEGKDHLTGGTLPYMSPEQMAALLGHPVVVDDRSDLFSLGVILYELLTLVLPFAHQEGPVRKTLGPLYEARKVPPTPIRQLNPRVSIGVATIVHRLLEFDPANRYASAEWLKDDLDRHVDNQPLKHIREPSLRERFQKWRRRHPSRLAGMMGATTIALSAVLANSVVRQSQERERVANARVLARNLTEAIQSAPAVLAVPNRPPEAFADLIASLDTALAPFGVLQGQTIDNAPITKQLPRGELVRAQHDVVEGLRLLSLAHLRRGQVVEAGGDDYEASDELIELALKEGQRGGVNAEKILAAKQSLVNLVRSDTDGDLVDQEDDSSLNSEEAMLAKANMLLRTNRYRDAIGLLTTITDSSPQKTSAWRSLARAYVGLGKHQDAVVIYTTLIARLPEDFNPYLRRGICYLQIGNLENALRDIDRALRLNPKSPTALYNRALIRERRGERDLAIDDLSRAALLLPRSAKILFKRARLLTAVGDPVGADQDVKAALELRFTDARSWICRAAHFLPTDAQQAADAAQQALRISPNEAEAYRWLVLSFEKLNKPESCLDAAESWVSHDPDNPSAAAALGLLLARKGECQKALSEAKRAQQSTSQTKEFCQQIAGIYAQCSVHDPALTESALNLVAQAIQQGASAKRIAEDRDLAPLKRHPKFQRLIGTVLASNQTATPVGL